MVSSRQTGEALRGSRKTNTQGGGGAGAPHFIARTEDRNVGPGLKAYFAPPGSLTVKLVSHIGAGRHA